jgi:putative oxygen-independent coproporphyrinogen III oxidase
MAIQKIPAPPLAIYIHWPFCKKKCPYCDFNSNVRDQVDAEAWRQALIRELLYWQNLTSTHQVTSIFFGGGTPSLMPPAILAALIDTVREHWHCAPDMEITMEANPTSVEAANFAAARKAGVNRLSLGVQSLRPDSLKFLGREHSADEARAAITLAAEHFPRYSFDLIYALPHQTLNTWEKELREALTYARGHLSLYQLTIEENTAFHHQYHQERAFTLPEEGLAAEMYELTQRVMASAGLPAYEISNHAAHGQESRHNLSYWRGESYLGIGAGAHGRVDMEDGVRLATRNLKSPERWLEQATRIGHGLEENTPLDALTRAEEKLLMGLRLTQEGLSLSTLREDERAILLPRLASKRLKKLQAEQLVTYEDECLRVTAKGALLLNAITAEIVTRDA